MPFPTPESLPPTHLCRRLSIPDDPVMVAAVSGALVALIDPAAWEPYGAVSPTDAAAAAFAMLRGYYESDVCMIGVIVQYATENAPAAVLPCDGGVYDRVDYPMLYDAIDPIYRVDADTFSVPDMRGRSVVGSGTGSGLSARSLGDADGEEQHTLTVIEMPPHNHSETIAVSSIINGGLEAPASAAIPSIGSTGNSGGGDAHNNMMPFYVLHYGIVAR